jgi:cytochrome bd-type quinol oxidase subunit 2
VLPGQLTLAEASAPAATVRAVLIVLVVGFALVVPALGVLLRTFDRPGGPRTTPGGNTASY